MPAAIIFALLVVGVLLLTKKGVAATAGGFPGRRPLSQAVYDLSTAIAKFETAVRVAGPFPLDPSLWQGRAKANKNPGNLRFIGQAGSMGQDGAGYAIFPSPQLGWNALLADVRAKLTGATRTGLGPESTLYQFISVYAPASENPTTAYIAFVAAELGVPASARFVDWIDYGSA